VPNGALRFKPDLKPEALQALYQKYGIEPPRGKGQADGQAGDLALLWELLPDKSLAPVEIRTGITDHTYTEVAQVVKGEMKPGDQLATGSATATPKTATPAMGARGVGR